MSNPYWYPQSQYGMAAPQPVLPPYTQQPAPNWGWNNYAPNYGYPVQPYPPQPNPYYPAQSQYGGQPQPVPPMASESAPPMTPQTSSQMTPQPVPPMVQQPSNSPQPVSQVGSQSIPQNLPQPVPPIEQQPTAGTTLPEEALHSATHEQHSQHPSQIVQQQQDQQMMSQQHSQAQMAPHPPQQNSHQELSQQMAQQQAQQQINQQQQQQAPQMVPQPPQMAQAPPQMIQPPPHMMPQAPLPHMMHQQQQPPPQMMTQQQPPPQMMPQQQPPPPQMMPQQQPPPPQMMPQQQPPPQMMPQQQPPPQMMPYPGPQAQPPPWHQPPPAQYNQAPNYNQYNQGPNPPQFNSDYNNHGPNQFNQGPNQYNNNPPNHYNNGHSNHYNNGPNQFNHGPKNQFNHGQNQNFKHDAPFQYNRDNNNSFEREPWSKNSYPVEDDSSFNGSFSESHFSAIKRNKRGRRGGRKVRMAAEKRARLEINSRRNDNSWDEYKHMINTDDSVFSDYGDNEEAPSESTNIKDNSTTEEIVMNETTPIPEHLKEGVPRTGTTVSTPVIYQQSDKESQQDNSTTTDLSSENIYSLANKYNSVCLQRSEGFPEKKSSTLLTPPPKIPAARRYNFEDQAASKLFCFMCRIECQAEADFMTHFSGRKHLKIESNLKRIDTSVKEQIAMKIYASNTESTLNMKCNICEQILPTIDLFKTHLNGFKHKHGICGFITKGIPVPEIAPEYEISLSEERRDLIVQEIVEYEENLKKGLAPTVILPPESTAAKNSNILIGDKFIVQHKSLPSMWYCRLCKVNLSPSDSVRNEHCKGRQHRGNFIYKMSDSDNEAFKIFNGENIPLVTRTNWQEDCKHYSAQPNTLIAFESFRGHPCVPQPIINNQVFITNKNTCPFIDFIEEDHCLEKKSSEITNGKAAIHELYELVKYVSKTAYKITYAINEILLEFKATGESEEVRYQKSLETASYKVASGLLLKQLENLPANHSCYYTTVVRTDIIGKGYILNNEDKLELVMICDFLPTKQILELYEAGFNKILNQDEDRDRTITVMGNNENSSLSILYMTEQLEPIMEIILNFTSKLYCNRDLTPLREIPTMLNIDKGLYYLSEIRQMRWFKEKHIYYPYFMFVIRILRDFRRRNEPWRKLSLYSMELVLDHLLRNCKTFVSPAILLKNFFRFFATVHLNTQTLFGDICEVDYSNPFKHLTDSECDAIKLSANNALNLIEKRKMNRILYYPIPKEIKD